MRRKDREVSERSAILDIMQRCPVCHVAFGADDFPYVIPLSFAFVERNGEIILYFHSAAEGHKLDLLARDSKVAFSMEALDISVASDDEVACRSTVFFESVCGNGEMRLLTGEDKRAGIIAIAERYRMKGGSCHILDAALERTAVMALHVRQITGKRHTREQG